MTEKFRRILSVIAVLCFFLPLCQCTTKVFSSGASSAVTKPARTDIMVPAARIEFKELSEGLLIAAFCWPLAALAVRQFLRAPWQTACLSAVELLASAAALIYLVSIIRLWGEVLYGGVLITLCYLAYALIAGLDIVRFARTRSRT